MKRTSASVRMRSWLAILIILDWIQVNAFTPSRAQLRNSSPSTSALDCICIDCKWVTSCKAYHFVEAKHEQPHMTDDPTFEPRDGSPTIHVNIRNDRKGQPEREQAKKMFREHAEETKRAMEAQAQDDDDSSPLIGSTKYDLSPQITYEYDVVACEDFVEEKGCWVRNMPEEIRRANPDFVPT